MGGRDSFVLPEVFDHTDPGLSWSQPLVWLPAGPGPGLRPGVTRATPGGVDLGTATCSCWWCDVLVVSAGGAG